VKPDAASTTKIKQNQSLKNIKCGRIQLVNLKRPSSSIVCQSIHTYIQRAREKERDRDFLKMFYVSPLRLLVGLIEEMWLAKGIVGGE